MLTIINNIVLHGWGWLGGQILEFLNTRKNFQYLHMVTDVRSTLAVNTLQYYKHLIIMLHTWNYITFCLFCLNKKKETKRCFSESASLTALGPKDSPRPPWQPPLPQPWSSQIRVFKCKREFLHNSKCREVYFEGENELASKGAELRCPLPQPQATGG